MIREYTQEEIQDAVEIEFQKGMIELMLVIDEVCKKQNEDFQWKLDNVAGE